MNRKNLSICTLSMAAALLICGILTKILYAVPLLTAIDSVICPILFILVAVGAYFIFKDKTTYYSKWSWAVIVLQAGMAVQNITLLPNLLFFAKAPLAVILPVLLLAGASVVVVLSLLTEKFGKLLPIGLSILTLGALAGGDIRATMLYAALTVIALDSFPKLNKYIRIAAVVLAVLDVVALGVLAAAVWIIFAFILVPAEKKELRINFALITAVAFVLAALLGAFTYVSHAPFQTIKYRNESIDNIKQEILDQEEYLAFLQEELANRQNELTSAEAALAEATNALAAAEAAVEDAYMASVETEAALDQVCSRDYYGWNCDKECEYLHAEVEARYADIELAESQIWDYEEAVYNTQYQVENLKSEIAWTEEDLANTEESILQLKEQLSDLRAQLLADVFYALVNVLAILLAAAALVCLAICFFKADYSKLALPACAALTLSSLLYILLGGPVTVAKLIASPYAWSIVCVAFLAVLFIKKEGKLVKFRVLAIIAAVIMVALSAISGSVVVFAVYALAVICATIVLVPVVFTEYISIAKHLFFSLISMGVWQCIWIYNVTKNLNKVSDADHRKPALELVLCMFLPFYFAYWLLKTGENVEAYGIENGKTFKLDILCLVFAFVCPLISTVLLQNKINKIVGKPE